MSSWETFFNNPGSGTEKWTQYFPAFDRYFTPWKNRTLTFLEVGVANGGSGPIWSKFFGTKAQIIGIDINPKCKQHENTFYQIRIGDQSDSKFLQTVIDEFGVPDIVLDDGSHRQEHIYETFKFFYPKMHLNSIYMVEDLHCAYWPSHNGGLNSPHSFINRSKSFIDQLNINFTKELEKDPILDNTFSISFYNSMIVFEKGKVYRYEPIQSGRV